jgi:putative heme-binding domain-containing protein
MLRLACQSPDNALRSAALDALACYDNNAIADEVIKSYSNMTEDVRASAQNLLATRRIWADRFLQAINNHTLDQRTVHREVVEKLLLLGDARINDQVNRLFGPIKPATGAELHGQIDRLAASIRAGSGIPKPGKQIFDRECGRCHVLFGKGGKVGPDLTTYRRDDLETMLLNIVNPSAVVREGFSTLVVSMVDGRVVTGVVVEQDKNIVVIRGNDGKDIAIARALMEAMRILPTSIMPEGLMKGLSDQEVRDLFAYLRSTQPLID